MIMSPDKTTNVAHTTTISFELVPIYLVILQVTSIKEVELSVTKKAKLKQINSEPLTKYIQTKKKKKTKLPLKGILSE